MGSLGEKGVERPATPYLLSTLVMVGLMMVIALFFITLAAKTESERNIIWAMLGFAAVLIVMMQMLEVVKARRAALEERKSISIVIECQECGEKLVRDFQRGDYVGKEEKCKKCGGKAMVTLIYSEKIR
ncbi:MAG: hypothetical protein DRN96_04465 [Thermoproteota archaeon]|nr:MAG: hypothetical protein DRN96_04465 [Candidatus Korarchaeota archaeon]RLG56026.1 MAG: hypothetical protein DRN99_00815 [Candidatus Korarchaeota archaeon]